MSRTQPRTYHSRAPESLHTLIVSRTAAALAAEGKVSRTGTTTTTKPPENMSEFERTVRRMCAERNISLGHLNKLMGRSKSFIHQIFSLNRQVTPATMRLVDDALGTREFAASYEGLGLGAQPEVEGRISGNAPAFESDAREPEPVLAPSGPLMDGRAPPLGVGRGGFPNRKPRAPQGPELDLSVAEIIEREGAAPVVPTRRMTITPQIAKRFLQHNKTNRSISTAHVQWFAQQIRDGAWDSNNGETIKFAADGGLMDGQHRLMGCVLANMPIETQVQFGLPWESQSTIDVGRKRTIGDQLSINGEKYGNQIASAVRWVHAIAKGSVAYKTSTPEVKRFIAENPEIRRSVAYVRGHKFTGMTPTLLSAMHFLAAHVLGKPEKADAMIKVFITGYPAYEGDPMHRCREAFMEARARGHTIGQARQAAMLIHAWNLFSNNIGVRNLRMPNEIRLEGFDPSQIGVLTEARIPSQTTRLSDGTPILEPVA